MYVETWSHFGTVLTNIRGVLSPANKLACGLVISWGIQQGNNYFGINQTEINEAKNWVQSITGLFTGQSATDLANSYVFLSWLNTERPASHFKTQEGCTTAGWYWYGNICHEGKLEPLPPPPPPPEPPPPPPPEPEPEPIPPIPPLPPIPAGLEALLEQVEAFYDSIPIGQIIKKGIVLVARNWLRAIVSFQQFISKRNK